MQVYLVNTRIDRLVIAKFLNTEMLGLYEKGKSISSMPSDNLGDKVNTVLFSSFSRLQNDRDQVNNYFVKGLTILSILIYPIYFGIISIASHFVLSLMGENWINMINILEILCL